jgi:uncharacterized protein (DUF4415 family)
LRFWLRWDGASDRFEVSSLSVREWAAVSVRLDPQVLDWLRSKGEGHLTCINDILVNLMEAERRIEAGR